MLSAEGLGQTLYGLTNYLQAPHHGVLELLIFQEGGPRDIRHVALDELDTRHDIFQEHVG